MNKKTWLILTIIIWITFIGSVGLVYYVNHYMPRGSEYATGDYVCLNDNRGPCRPEYKEDLRNVNIPGWAKFFRQDQSLLLLVGLAAAGILTGHQCKEWK